MSRTQGFTLIELMVTIAIAAILMGIAIPAFRDMLNSSKLTTQTNQLITALHLARSEAIKRGVRVTVCKSTNPGDAAPTCSTSANWQDGLIVFVDNTQISTNVLGVIDGVALDPVDEVVRVFGPFPGSTLTASTNFSRAVSYLPSSLSKGVDSSGSPSGSDGNFRFSLGGQERLVCISTTGRIYSTARLPLSCY